MEKRGLEAQRHLLLCSSINGIFFLIFRARQQGPEPVNDVREIQEGRRLPERHVVGGRGRRRLDTGAGVPLLQVHPVKSSLCVCVRRRRMNILSQSIFIIFRQGIFFCLL